MPLDREALLAESLEIDRLCGCEPGVHIYRVIRRLNAHLKNVIEETVDPDPPPDSPPSGPPTSYLSPQRF